jgi:hypothetical protein
MFPSKTVCEFLIFPVIATFLLPSFIPWFSNPNNIEFQVFTVAIVKPSAFRNIKPCSPVKVNGRPYSVAMGATCFSKTTVDFQRTSRHKIKGDSLLSSNITRKSPNYGLHRNALLSSVLLFPPFYFQDFSHIILFLNTRIMIILRTGAAQSLYVGLDSRGSVPCIAQTGSEANQTSYPICRGLLATGY